MLRRAKAIVTAAVHWARRRALQGRDSAPVIPGAVDYAGWLANDMLIATGWIQLDEGATLDACMIVDGRTLPLETSYTSYSRPDVPKPQAGKVLTLHPLSPELLRQPLGRLVLSTARGSLVIASSALAKSLTDLQTALASGVGWLDAKTRSDIMDFVTSALSERREVIDSLQLNRSLLAASEALHAELSSADQLRNLQIDALLAIDETFYYLRGWMHNSESDIRELAIISPEGFRVQLNDKCFSHHRRDVEKVYSGFSNHLPVGFISYFEMPTPTRLSSGWKVEMRSEIGGAARVLAPSVTRDLVTVRNTVLEDLALEPPLSETLIQNYTFPVISKLQERHNKTIEAERVHEYGTLGGSPEVSIIVPLYRRIDLLEQQMAHFFHDPEINQNELVYVLDSPELADELAASALHLFRLYRIPFRVVVLKQNAGFSGVNNIGSSVARGRLLLLLNSDVFPEQPGWLAKMQAFYDSKPNIGALGPKLLYEDDSLQHAGLYFFRPLGASVWENQHYFKGLHRRLAAANVTRPVPAVTAACLMIHRELYQEIGGLRGIYVQGDYEDSDLCLRLLDAGYENWYLAEVELYHLEGQSYPSAARRFASRYNAWLHTHLWNDQIERVMAQYDMTMLEMPPLEGGNDHTARHELTRDS